MSTNGKNVVLAKTVQTSKNGTYTYTPGIQSGSENSTLSTEQNTRGFTDAERVG